MTTLLPELHDGHAPIMLQQLFRDALEAYDDWGQGALVPMVEFQGERFSIAEVFDHMRFCTDILPRNMLIEIKERLTRPISSRNSLDEMTFSTAARVMCVLLRKRAMHHDDANLAMVLKRLSAHHQMRPAR